MGWSGRVVLVFIAFSTERTMLSLMWRTEMEIAIVYKRENFLATFCASVSLIIWIWFCLIDLSL